MTKAELPQYSCAFHEAGHVVVGNRYGIPYMSAAIEGAGGLGGEFRVDQDAVNRELVEKKGDIYFAKSTLCRIIYTLKGGEAVDREVVRLSEPEIERRASGDRKSLEEVIRPICVSLLGWSEIDFRSTVEHAGRACLQIVTTPYMPLVIARVADLIYQKKHVEAAELNALIAGMID